MTALGIYFGMYLLPKEREGFAFTTLAFRWGSLFCGVTAVTVALGYLMAPDWFLMYFVEGQRPGFLGLIFILGFVYYLTFIAGFLVKLELDKLGVRFLNHLLMGALFLVTYLIGGVFLADRFWRVGTREEFLAGTAKPFLAANHGLSWLMIVYGAFVVGFLVYFHFRVYRPAKLADG